MSRSRKKALYAMRLHPIALGAYPYQATEYVPTAVDLQNIEPVVTLAVLY